MLNLPANTPEAVFKFCRDCRSKVEAVNKLQEDTDLFIQFFKTVSEDKAWMNSNKSLVNKMESHFVILSQSAHLSLNQARTVRLIAQAAAAILDPKVVKEFAGDDVTIKVSGGKEVKIHHVLLSSESDYFKTMFMSDFKEGINIVLAFPKRELETLSAIKTFLEKGEIANLAEKDVLKLFQASQEYIMPNLESYLLENHLNGDNILEFIDMAYASNSKKVRDHCFKFIEDNFEGIKISANGFRDMTVTIEKYSKDLLESLTPFFNYFNPNVKKATVHPDFRLSVNIGENAFPLDFKEAQAASVSIFKMFPHARDVDLNETSPLVDSIISALGMCCPKLQTLDLRNCYNITDSGLESLKTLTSLQTLDLFNCKKITDSGLEHLKALTSLQTLNLLNCGKITDKGLEHLKTLTSLQSLNLEDCYKITDRGLEHLKALTSLQSLDLFNCEKITDNGLEHLKALTSLQSLNLGGCDQITSSGFEHLKALTSLQTLNLAFCKKITDRGIKTLKRELPNIKIIK